MNNPFTDADFRTSSPDAGSCVEVALGEGLVGVRDSKDPDSAVLLFGPAEWNAFLSGIKRGDFDLR